MGDVAALRRAGILDTIVLGRCEDLLVDVPDDSVDLVLADLPYGTTKNTWDSVLDLEFLWEQYWRVLKDDGVVVLTAAQPYTSILVTSNLPDFKCEWIWLKTVGSNQLNTRHQPLRVHESVLVYYRKRPTYNQQTTTGRPYTVKRKASTNPNGYSPQRDVTVSNDGTRVPRTVVEFANPRIRGGHPSQKPLRLFEYFVETYTNPGDVVLDHCIGSGTTAVAALRTGRHYVGMESDAAYHAMAERNVLAARNREFFGLDPSTVHVEGVWDEE